MVAVATGGRLPVRACFQMRISSIIYIMRIWFANGILQLPSRQMDVGASVTMAALPFLFSALASLASAEETQFEPGLCADGSDGNAGWVQLSPKYLGQGMVAPHRDAHCTCQRQVAGGGRFELPRRLHARRFSRPVQSTTLPPTRSADAACCLQHAI